MELKLRRSVVFGIGTLLLIFNAFFGAYSYVVVQALIWTQTSLLRGPVVMLCLILMVNALLLKWTRRFALSQAEMLALYSMMAVGTCAGGLGFVQILINQMAGVFYYATAGNKWKQTLWPNIPHWLAPRDPAVINPFFRGRSTLYSATALEGWAVPVLAWSAFIFAIFWVLLCATSLLRRRWVEEEKLTFPLVTLPIAMTEQGNTTPFWRNKWMWAGFLLAGLLESVNFLNFLLPWVPSIPIKPIGPNVLDQNFTSRPWNTLGMLRLAFYPWVIGIGYILSLDVSFSCWAMYLLVKVANVLTAMSGLSEPGGSGPANRAPFVREQGLGAFVGIAVLSLWMARSTLQQAWQESLHPTGADRNELMPFRLALGGGMAGMLFLMVFLTAAGLPAPMAMVYVFVYVAFAITLARIVSEAGAGWAWSPNWSTTAFAGDAFGTNHLSVRQLTILVGYTEWTNDMRDNPMPQEMQAARLAPAGGIAPRALLGPLVWAAAFGILCAFWAHLHIYYTYGAASGKVRPWLASLSPAPFNHAISMNKSPQPQDVAGMVAAGFGILFAIGLSILRQRFTWWPFHPLGYALATTNSMDYMWFPFFLAWVAKCVTLRYGGVRMYRMLLPFFLGLILGDYVVPSLWGIGGMISGNQQYLAFPH